MKHNYCQSPSQLPPRQQSHFLHAVTEQQGAEYLSCYSATFVAHATAFPDVVVG